MIGILLFGRNYKKRIATLEAKLAKLVKQQEPTPAAKQSIAESPTVDYLEAGDIIDRYIHLATHDKKDGVKLIIRRNFIERFEKTTGAMLGPGRYNRELLHQWMQSNAARFLVEHRSKMT